MAVSTATQVIEEDADNVKALFRRSQAYRALDEYGYVKCSLLDSTSALKPIILFYTSTSSLHQIYVIIIPYPLNMRRLAESDILKASRLCPADNGIQREIKALQVFHLLYFYFFVELFPFVFLDIISSRIKMFTNFYDYLL